MAGGSETRLATPSRPADRVRALVVGALLAGLLSAGAVAMVTQIWSKPLNVPFQYAHVPGDDEQDATLDLMLIKNIHETGWFSTNPQLNAPYAQHWAEWPMGGDLLAYTIKKGIVGATGDFVLTFNLFWLLTFPLTALVAFPVLRTLRCSRVTALAGAVLFSVAPYHFRNGAGHENLAFYVGIPIIVLICVRMLGPDSELPSVSQLRDPRSWRRLTWPIAGTVLIAVTGIYYLAFLLSLLAICAAIGAIARRRPGRLVVATIFGVVGLTTAFVANLPTLLYRWSHPINPLGVPDRSPAISENYPLRIVELLSPVTGHRFPPFAAIADQLYMPGRRQLATAQLGLAAAVGLVVAVVAVLVRALRSSRRGGWRLEARLGIVILATLFLGTAGGFARALELLGLQGVRAWSRIAIVAGFAAIVVFARLLDRLRVLLVRSRPGFPRLVWPAVITIVVVAGVLDQASPVLMPQPEAREGLWRADQRFVTALERRLPAHAMVFQLPVVDFPEHGSIRRMAAHDLIKEGYLHSATLRWSAGGIRGRDGEWQWPAAQLSLPDLIRGVTAMGFRALMVDRYGYADNGSHEVQELRGLLGAPIAARGDRLVAWDLRPAAATLLAGTTVRDRREIARRMTTAPRVYLSSDADPIVGRGGQHAICAEGRLTLVNPGRRRIERELTVVFDGGRSTAVHGRLTIGGRTVPLSTKRRVHHIPVNLPAGNTDATVDVHTPGLRCPSAPVDAFPTIAARFATP